MKTPLDEKVNHLELLVDFMLIHGFELCYLEVMVKHLKKINDQEIINQKKRR